jgi:hypothetical protein
MTMTQGTSLVELALEASGGLDRWRKARTIRAWLSLRGPTWDRVGQPTILDGVRVEVDVHRQHTVFRDFTGPGRRGVFTPDRVTVEDSDGTALEERGSPRDSYQGRDNDWDALHALYFAGYAIWNYLTTPYLLTLPGVQTEELEPTSDGGGHWRRARVSFPSGIATHCPEQVWSYDRAGLLRRMEYAPYVRGSRPSSHEIEGHTTFDGLVFPTHRYVLPVTGGRRGTTPTIKVDFVDITVEYAS